MEDQAVHIVRQIDERDFGLGAPDADGTHEQAHLAFCWANTCSTRARTLDFVALPRRICSGIGLPLGLRRWTRLT